MTTREQLIKALRAHARENSLFGDDVRKHLSEKAADMLEADWVPVAWMWEVLPGSKVSKLRGKKKGAYFEDPSSVGFDIESEQSVANYKWTLLYTAPQTAIQERKPMTDEHVKTLFFGLKRLEISSRFSDENWFLAGVLASESAHGIGAKP